MHRNRNAHRQQLEGYYRIYTCKTYIDQSEGQILVKRTTTCSDMHITCIRVGDDVSVYPTVTIKNAARGEGLALRARIFCDTPKFTLDIYT